MRQPRNGGFGPSGSRMDEQSSDDEIHVVDLMDTNCGDEHHLEENWTECPADDCGVDVRVDMDECWKCGEEVQA